MPEAPEVSNVLAYLEENLKGAQIESVKVTHPKLAANESVEDFERKLAGEHFRKFIRHGKYLIFEMDDLDFVAHLRMEGKFLLYNSLEELEAADPIQDKKHIHAIFSLSDGRILAYKDTRKFGRMYLYPKTEDVCSLPVFDKVGKDALDPGLTAKELYEKTRKRKLPIKSILLDQKVIAGIGNIYADEILFDAGLAPQTPASHLDLADWQKILQAARSILADAASQGGTTIRSFSYGTNHGGSYQNQLKVHAREDGLCGKCQGELVRLKIGGRSTWYCPACQKEK